MRSYTVSKISYDGDNPTEIVINFEETDDVLTIIAKAECSSWFVLEGKLEKLIGQKITELIKTSDRVDLGPSKIQQYDKYDRYYIRSDSFKVKFILCNSSNGYYSGWVVTRFRNQYDDFQF